MDITIGVQHIARDISLETEQSAEAISQKVTEAIAADGMLNLTEPNGRNDQVTASTTAYVDT